MTVDYWSFIGLLGLLHLVLDLVKKIKWLWTRRDGIE